MASSNKNSKSQVTSKTSLNTNFSEDSSKEFVKFAKMLTCAKQPLKETCPKCFENNDGYKLFYFFQTSRLHQFRYKTMINYNDEEKKVVISFAGPNAKRHAKYISQIYSNGFSWVREYKVQIESEYHSVYFNKLRARLVKKITQFKKSGREDYQFVFVGHSVGGSMAILASYDLTKRGLISKSHNHTKVFTYGSLRIGDERFVKLVNSAVYLYRIINSGDYVVRYPTCYYSIPFNSWRCYTGSLLRNYITSYSSPIYYYLQNYRYSVYYSMPVATAITRFSTPIIYRHHAFVQKSERSKAIAKTKSKSNKDKMLPRRDFGRMRRMNNTIRNPFISRGQVRNTERSISRMPQLSLNKETSHPLNLHKAQLPRTHITPQHNEKKVKLPAKPDNREKELKTERKLNKLHQDSTAKPTTTDNTKQTTDQKSQQAKQQQPQDKTAITKKQVQAVKQISNLPKLHIAPKVANNYFYSKIYYTQPFGHVVYYNSGFSNYSVCTYVLGVPSCERRIVLPATFSVGPHFIYYDVNFDEC